MITTCRVIGVLVLLTAFAVGLLAQAPEADARPLRGHVTIATIFCNFSDRPAVREQGQPLLDVLFNGPDSVSAYWMNISDGAIRFTVSGRGWVRLPIRFAEYPGSRQDLISLCVDSAARDGYVAPEGARILAYVNACRDSGTDGLGRVLLDPCALNTAWAAHELGHALGLRHSFSTDTGYRNTTWSSPGEYDDPWDLMSCMNCGTRATAKYGQGPPGLNAYHLDRLGWIPSDRIFRFGAVGQAKTTVTLRAQSEAARPGGYLLARIPFDPADLNAYYTVSLRTSTGVDAATGPMRVLIHRVKNDISYLVRSGRTAVENFSDPVTGVHIRVISKDTVNHTARVEIESPIATRCLLGYVWRGARPSDRVCVTPARRAETRTENALASSRRSPNGGAFGSDTCKTGFVWREAYPDDHVCVPGATRSIVRKENRTAAGRVNPARLVWGPNACKQGFVWRQADKRDYVCVVPATRAETQTENALAPTRRDPNGGPWGSNTCKLGFVWREAFIDDFVCVPGSSRTRALADNALAVSRLERP